MNQRDPIASMSVADQGGDASFATGTYPTQTVLSQYATSPILTAIIQALASAIDAQADLDLFYSVVWDVRTASGFGLDILGRIVGVNRVLRIPAGVPYLGFKQQTEANPFGFGIWFNGSTATQNYSLTDTAFRRLVLAKAALNICDGSIPAINAALRALFSAYGNCYVQDNGGMAMTYVFGSQLSPVDLAIVAQAGVLPKPIGVSVSGQVAS